MTKTVSKISDKLTKVNESFTINMYDNGYMVEVGGRDSSDEWKTAKIMVASTADLLNIISDVVNMPRAD